MATKQKPTPDRKPSVPQSIVRKEDEGAKVRKWRQEQFVRVLRESGLTDEQIDLNNVSLLVESTASPHDLKKLIEKGCDPETAIRILA
jgi:hypothetical protein